MLFLIFIYQIITDKKKISLLTIIFMILNVIYYSIFGFVIQETQESNVNIDDFFVDAEQKVKEPKKIKCPHCGELIEV